jgi:hypothetical protein
LWFPVALEGSDSYDFVYSQSAFGLHLASLA